MDINTGMSIIKIAKSIPDFGTYKSRWLGSSDLRSIWDGVADGN